jgi:ribose transport system permease protein
VSSDADTAASVVTPDDAGSITTSADGAASAPDGDPTVARRLVDVVLGPYSGLIIWIGLIVFFSIKIPDVFLTDITFRTLLSDQAVTGILALAVALPLAAGLVDLSFASIAGFSMVLSTWLSINTGWHPLLLIIVTIAAAVGFGCLSSILVTTLQVNSLVATLGVSAVSAGITGYISDGRTLTARFGDGTAEIGRGYFGDVAYPVVYLLALAIALFLFLEYTGGGRKVLATGGNVIAARLAGIKVGWLQTSTLMVSAAISGFAGIVLATKVGQSTDQTGAGYLLPALAAVFLGATQVRSRVNVLGTLIAVYLLGTGIKGLQLMGAKPWVNSLFNGIFLLLAVSLGAGRRRALR